MNYPEPQLENTNFSEPTPEPVTKKGKGKLIAIIIILILLIAGAAGYFVLNNPQIINPHPQGNLKIVAQANGVYLGAYNWGGDGIKTFEDAVGKKVAIVGGVCSTPENQAQKFDINCFENLYQKGYVSTTGYEWAGNFSSPDHSIERYTVQEVIDGKADFIFTKMAQDIRKFNKPVFWAYQREPEIQPAWGYDGGGYGVDGSKKFDQIITTQCQNVEIDTRFNCPELYNQYQSPFGNSCDTAGDKMCLDGPERYRDGVRHMHDVVEATCPNCVTWIGAAVLTGSGGEGNMVTYEQYYPGDNYVDWHAMDFYPNSSQVDTYDSITKVIDSQYQGAMKMNPNKPVLFLEFGVKKTFAPDNTDKELGSKTALPSNRQSFFNDFFSKIKTDYSKLGAFLYWQTDSISLKSSIRSSDADSQSWRTELSANPSFWFSNVTLANKTTLSGPGGGITTNTNDNPDQDTPDNNQESNGSYVKILPPTKGIYLSTPNLNDVNDIESTTGAKVSMVSSTKGDIAEGGNLYFNLAGHRQLDALGYVTGFMIDNSNYHSSENSTQSFGPQDILDGKMDAQIKQIATAIKQFRKPITWQYPKEPAGTIFSLFGANGKEDANWIGVVNDTCTLGSAMNCLSNPWNFNQYVSKYGTSCNTNGDMMCLDGAERYRDLARYYYEFMEKEGAGKYITWMMGDSWPGNANYATMPELYKSIYPGDKYVDYHSMMLYANGENGIHFWSNYGDAGCAKAVLETGLDQNKCSWTDKWEEVIEPFWTQAMSVSPNKPVFITEGSVESVTRNPNFSGTGKYLPAVYETKDSSAWFNDFFTQIRTNPRYKNLAGWNYWQNSGFWDLGEPGSAASNQVRIDSGSLVPGMLASDDWKTETSNYPQNWPTSVRCGIFDANGTMTSEIKCTDFTPSMLGEQTINGSGEGPSNNNEQPSNCLSNCIATGKTTDQCNDQCATAGTGGETGNGTGCVGADCTAGNGETGNQSTCVSTCMAGGKTLDQCNVQCAAQ